MKPDVELCTVLFAMVSAVVLVMPVPIRGATCDARSNWMLADAVATASPERRELDQCMGPGTLTPVALRITTDRQVAAGVPAMPKR